MFSKLIEEMLNQKLNDCLKSFYISPRKQDSSYHNTSSMKSIRRHFPVLRSVPERRFDRNEQSARCFYERSQLDGKMACVAHKKPISKQQIQQKYECGELSPVDCEDE